MEADVKDDDSTTLTEPLDYRCAAEWMATYILGRLPDPNTMTPDEIADYEKKLEEIVDRVAEGIGKP